MDPHSHTRAFIERLYDPDELLCLVMLNGEPQKTWGKTTCGFYRPADRETFFEHARRFDGKGSVYVNLNRLTPDVYGRAAGRYKTWSKTRFIDDEITRRARVLVDLDPVRVAGVNSTNEELQRAIALADVVRPYLIEQFKLDPLTICSGNGVQLVARIDEPVDSSSVGKLLKHLADKFDSRWVKIDQSVSDAARITRLPGTLNCKGDNIPERPRRYATMEALCLVNS